MTIVTPEVRVISDDLAPANNESALDVIDQLVGIEPGSAIAALRNARPETKANAQASYIALFAPEYPGTVTERERFAIATFVIGLHDDAETRAFYESRLGEHDVDGLDTTSVVLGEIALGATTGPYGFYPAAPLKVENVDGLRYRVAAPHRDILGSRLVSAFEHAHLLVFRPRESSASALQTLLDAGWSTTDIVTLSQLVAFLSFQVRVIAGLRLLAADIAASSPHFGSADSADSTGSADSTSATSKGL